ncbi:MAG: PAS domain S-box protein [Euryarchaeota archaeon]|nr:PAS domain S-box protein [Euryarchaeota archaeon]
MLSSIGFTIMFNPMGLPYVFHYVLFGCLLLVVLIDYQYVLKGVESPRLFKKKEPAVLKINEPEPVVSRAPSFFAKKEKPAQQTPRPLHPAKVADFQRISDAMVQKMQNVVHDLERKTERIETLENLLSQQKKHPPSVEKIFSNPTAPPPGRSETVVQSEKALAQNISTEEKIILKERIENHLIIDEMDNNVAVIQRGIFRDISNSFADFLGYERAELLQKNFFVFVAPRGFEDARKYYLNRLKGITTNSFRTVLLTKAQTELLVEITVAPTVYKGDSAEFLSIKEIKDQS